tara:strand:+ start:5263 stop:6045 length:783 start_codon:yes stop_codon:yes gene_type:complete
MHTQQQKLLNVLLIGDSCEDVYHYGTCDRISPEAPVPIFNETSKVIKKGMSSNVRLNLEALGIFVTHYTNNEKISKHRFVDSRHNQHLLRWDEGEEKQIELFNVDFLQLVKQSMPDAVVISDYDKGFLSFEVCIKIVDFCKQYEIPIFVDTKKKDLTCYNNCVIKINEKEFSNIENFPVDSEFVITLGENGARYKNQIFKTTPVEVFDVCGAGDVFLSALVYGYLKTNCIADAIPIANKLAAISVTHMGTYVLTKKDINQ